MPKTNVTTDREREDDDRIIKIRALEIAASQAGFLVPGKVHNFLESLDVLSVDDSGRVYGSTEAVQAVADQYPEMFTSPRRDWGTPRREHDSGPLGPRPGDRPDPFSDESLARVMSGINYERM